MPKVAATKYSEVCKRLQIRSRVVDLLHQMLVQCGELGDEYEFGDDSKLVGGYTNFKPGASVTIQWKQIDDDFPGLVDDGYLIHFPIDDFDMVAIVHVPNPSGGEKCTPEAEWHTLSELLKNEQVESITLGTNERG